MWQLSRSRKTAFRLSQLYQRYSRAASGDTQDMLKFIISPQYLNQQSKLLPGPERIRISPITLNITDIPGPSTVYELVYEAAKISPTGNILGRIQNNSVQWISYEEMFETCDYIGAAMVQLGVERQNLVAVNWTNDPWFFTLMFANMCYNFVTSPLYPLLGNDAVMHILSQSTSKVYFVNDFKKADFVIHNCKHFPSLKTVVVENEPESALRQSAKEHGLQIISLQDMCNLGKKNPTPHNPPKPEDLATLVYTSGTTGLPKGAMLEHNKIIYAYRNMCGLLQGSFIKPGEIIVSYMPPAHIYEMMMQFVSIGHGASVVSFRNNLLTLLEDIQIIKPHLIPMVPRMMNRVHRAITDKVNESKLKSKIFNHAYNVKLNMLKNYKLRHDTIWDKIIFKKIKKTLGGRVRMILSTSAPLSANVLEFFRIVMGCHVIEVYGSTEVIIATFSSPGDPQGGHIGAPAPNVEIKLADVPENNYFSKDDVGEICIRSPYVFSGYYKNEKATADTIKNGWVHMGDIGRWNEQGTLSIFDRKKDIFKLSQGEYMSPERIEQAYLTLREIAMIFVDGDQNQNYCVAIVVPDEALFRKWLTDNGLDSTSSLAELCKDKENRMAFLKYMHDAGQYHNLHTLQQVRNIHIHPELFTIENDLLTTTMKMKRNVLRERFKQQIAAMYKEGVLVHLKLYQT